MSNLFIVFSIIIIQIIIIGMIYKIYKTIAQPAVFFQTYITIQIVLALVGFKDFDFSYSGLLWILFALFSFSIGSLLASGLTYKKSVKTNICHSYSIKLDLAKSILFTSILLGSLYSIELLIKKGISLNQLLNFQSLLEINHSLAVQRYSGDGLGASKISRIFLIFVYFAPLIGGFNLNFFENKRAKILCWFSLFPSFLNVLIQNTKAGWIAGVFLFISGYIASCIKLNQSLPRISFKKIFLILIGFLVFLSINYISMIMRLGHFNSEVVEIVNRRFLVYALGHFPAFDFWFTNNINFIEYNFGIKTFYGIADFIGITERVQGVYDDITVLGVYGGTNVYTIFRSFIEDFGSYLGLAVMFLYGFIMSYMFFVAKRKKAIFKGITMISSFYFYVLFSFTSSWTYMSHILAFVFFEIYLRSISLKLDTKRAYFKEEIICLSRNLI